MPIIIASGGRGNSIFSKVAFCQCPFKSDEKRRSFAKEIRLLNERTIDSISALRNNMNASDRKCQNVRVNV